MDNDDGQARRIESQGIGLFLPREKGELSDRLGREQRALLATLIFFGCQMAVPSVMPLCRDKQ